MKLTQTKEGTIMKVFVKPKQSRFKVIFDGEEITIFSTEDPVKSKVNREIVKELSKLFHSKVELISGATSKEKKLMIRELGKTETERLLQDNSSGQSSR